MSATTTPTVLPLSDDELVYVRWACGYPAEGSGPTLDPFNRTFALFPMLEFRINNLQPAEITFVRARVAEIQTAQTGLGNASVSLDTDQASVFKRNKNEVADRESHLDDLRVRLAQFIGVGPGPELRSAARSITFRV